MRKKLCAALTLLLCCAMLSGCFEQQSVDNTCYVLSFGIDRGKDKTYMFTVQAPQLGTGEDTGPAAKSIKMSVEADDIYRANEMMNVALPFLLDYSHCNFLVISEEIAKSKDIFDIMKVTSRLGMPKSLASLVIAKGTAKDFIDGLSSDIDPNMAKEQKNLMLQPSTSGLFPLTTVFEYMEGMGSRFDAVAPLGSMNKTAEKKDSEAKDSEAKDSENKDGEQTEEAQRKTQTPVPSPSEEDMRIAKDVGRAMQDPKSAGDIKSEILPKRRIEQSVSPQEDLQSFDAGSIERTGGLDSELMGCALFKNGIMVGELNGRETRIMMIAKGQFKRAEMSIIYKGEEHDIMLAQLKKPNIKVDISYGTPKANIEVFLGMSMLEDSIAGREADNQASIYGEKEIMEEFFLKQLETVTEKVYSTGSDAYCLGRCFVRKFAYLDDWNSFDWSDKVEDVEINFDINIDMMVTEDKQDVTS